MQTMGRFGGDFGVGAARRWKAEERRGRGQPATEHRGGGARRTELITHFRLLKSERDEVAGADGRQYRFICRRSGAQEEKQKFVQDCRDEYL